MLPRGEMKILQTMITKRPPWSWIVIGLPLAFSPAESRSQKARFTHSTGDTRTTVSVTWRQLSGEDPTRITEAGAARLGAAFRSLDAVWRISANTGSVHLGDWSQSELFSQNGYQPTDPFAVYEACYFPSNHILLTVAGVPQAIECRAQIFEGGALQMLPQQVPWLRWAFLYPEEQITNAILQAPSPTSATVLLIDREGYTNVVSWSLDSGWSKTTTATSAAKRAFIKKIEAIHLDEVGYRKAPLPELLAGLVNELKRRSPESGIYMGFYSSSAAVAAAQSKAGKAENAGQVFVTIDPPLKNPSLHEVLDAIVKGADTPIRYILGWDGGIIQFHLQLPNGT